jgi:hypothetical protein
VIREPGRGFAITALVCGIIGAALGLAAGLTFGIVIPLGVVAIVFGVIALVRRSRAHLPRGMAIAGTVLGGIALTLGIIGVVVFNDAVNELDEDLDEIGPSDPESYTPPSAAEIDAASDDELWDMWFEAPSGSEAEADLQAELEARGVW